MANDDRTAPNRQLQDTDARLSALAKRVRQQGPQVANDARTAPTWQLQDAKARFSELVKRAREQGPQHVSVRGAPAVVVISEEAFAKLSAPRQSIVDYILEGPPWPDDVVDAINERSRETDRDLAF
jgi:prevent-host-death family protein